MDVLIGPPRALTSGENLYSLTVRDRYTHTLGHTLLPKKPTTLPTRVLSALARVEGAAPAAGFHGGSINVSVVRLSFGLDKDFLLFRI